MSEDFDPYYVWLGIPPAEQPPNLYRLLGIPLYEGQQEVIQNAADQRMLHVRTFQSGPRGTMSQQLLNEIAAANRVLLDPIKKRDYDASLTTQAAAAIPVAPPAPPASPPVAHQPTQYETSQQAPASTPGQADIQNTDGLQPQPAQPRQAVQPPQFESKAALPRRRATSSSLSAAPARQSSCAVPVAVIGGVLGLFTAVAIVWVLTGRNALVELGFVEGTKSDKQSPALKQLPDDNRVSTDSKRSASKENTTNRNRANRDPVIDRSRNPPPSGSLPAKTVEESRPVAEPAKNLLHLIDPDRHASRGSIKIEPQGLSLINAVGRNYVILPIAPTTNYDLVGRVIRTDKATSGLCFGLLINEHLFDLSIDHQDRTGVELLDGRALTEHRFGSVGDLLPPVARIALKISVRSNGVALFLDGKKTYQWSGDPRRVKRPREPSIASRRYLNIHTTDAAFLIERLDYIAFPDGAEPLDHSLDTKPIIGSLPPTNPEITTVMPADDANTSDTNRSQAGAATKVESMPQDSDKENTTNPFVVDSDGASNSENPFDTERVFSAEEQKAIDTIDKTTRLVLRELNRNGAAKLPSLLSGLEGLDTFPEAKQKIEGVNQLIAQHALFRKTVVTACGQLEKGDELEVGDRLMTVVRASEEEIELQYVNSTVIKSPAELPTNVAMEVLLHSRPVEPTAEFLLMDGAAYAVDGGEENLKTARGKWKAAEDLGADASALLSVADGM